MRKLVKFLLGVLIAFSAWMLMPGTIKAYDDGAWSYSYLQGEITITAYNGSDSDVVIPDTLPYRGQQMPVTELGDDLFDDNTKLVSVTFGKNIDKLGYNVFRNCVNLERIKILKNIVSIAGDGYYSSIFENAGNYSFGIEVVFGEGVTEICDYLFYEAGNIVSVELPSTLTYIGVSAFYGCSTLKKVVFNNPNTKFYGQDYNNDSWGPFYGCKSSTIFKSYAGGNVEKYANQENFTFNAINDWKYNSATNTLTIYGKADMANMPNYSSFSETPWYKYASKITTIKLEGNVTAIGDNAFRGCTYLTKVIGCENVTSIGKYAFAGCKNLVSVAGCSKLTYLGGFAFDHCEKLTTIGSTAGTLNLSKVSTIPTNCFYMSKGFTNLVTGDALERIGSYAFRSSMGLKTATIGKNCKTLGDYCFNACTSLTTMRGCEGVTIIGKCTFNADAALTTVGATNGVVNFPKAQTITQYAFNACKGMKKFTTGGYLATVGAYVFNNCNNLTDITFKTNILSKVGMATFTGTNAKLTVSVPKAKVVIYKPLINGRGNKTVAIKGI